MYCFILGTLSFSTRNKPFDNHFKAPYIYNALAHHYKVIKTEDLTLVFDHTDRVKAFKNDPAQLEAFEKKYKGIVVGFTNKNQILVVRDNDEFFIVGNNLRTILLSSNPSINGILISVSKTSGCNLSIFSNASSPLDASDII